MIRELNTYHINLEDNPNNNIVALEISGGVTNADVQFFFDQFAKKRAAGHKRVNVLITLNQLDTLKSSPIAALRERLWGVINHRAMGRVAIVGNKRWFNWMENAVRIEAFFLMAANRHAEERYFDIKDLDKAFAFVEG